MNWFNVLERAAWTFVEAAISTFIGLEIALDIESFTSAIIASAAAGGAAALSVFKTVAQEQLALRE